MNGVRSRRMTCFVLLLLLFLAGHAAADESNDGALTLSDLVPYRAALEGKTGDKKPAVAVTFRALWDHPERYQGQRVRVEGRVARRFRQEAFGTFPPLIEAWAVSPSGDPFCLVFPAPAGNVDEAQAGALVRFEGTYLRRLRYQGGDVARLAPLIVGARPPIVTSPAPPKGRGRSVEPGSSFVGWGPTEWALGLGAAVVVALVLAHRHLQARTRRPLEINREIERPPEFVE